MIYVTLVFGLVCFALEYSQMGEIITRVWLTDFLNDKARAICFEQHVKEIVR